MFDKHLSVFILLLFCQMLIENTIAQNAVGDVPYVIPQEVEELRPRFHFAPINQDSTNACWSFSTLSFMESEQQRINGQSVKLSVMYPVYFGFIEKAKKYVGTRGYSRFTAGDLFTTVVDVVKNYGILPEEVYRGQAVERPTRNHERMENEIEELKKRIIKEEL
ncbi:MAG: hypothetical protein KAS58_08010, partial [Calditrichia bacterium]|nr:hypothetical protein [Calditrichia bacterium]